MPFVQACDKFIYTEVLRTESEPERHAKPATGSGETGQARAPSAPPRSAATRAAPVAGRRRPRPRAALPLELIRQAIEEASDDAGWAFLGTVGSYLNKIRPDFDPRLYGHRKLSDLFKHQPRHFAVEERSVGGGSNKMIYVRAVE